MSLASTKFIQLLRSLNDSEWKAFAGWLQSPWCNSNKNLIRLLAQLQRYRPDFTDRKLTKESLFYRILPNGKFSDRRMNNLLSEAYLAAERWLTFDRFSRSEATQGAMLIEALQEHDLHPWFFRKSEQQIQHLEQKTTTDGEDQLQLFQLYQRLYHQPNQDLRMQPGQSSIHQMEQALDLFYLLEKAALINEQINRKRVLKEEPPYDADAAISRWLRAAGTVRHPAIELYKLRFAYTEENRLQQYRLLRRTLLAQIDQLGSKEQKIHLLSLINDTMALIKAGLLDLTDSLPLYQLGLEKGILLHQGKLTRSTYSTIVIAANTQGNFTYTEHFIEQYTPLLDSNIRDDCHQWARAHTAYWRRQLEACLDLLQERPFQSAYFQMIGRVLQTQVYFDLYLRDDSYQFFLFSFLDTFEKWLNRNKTWSQQNKVAFLRFVQKCRALARYYSEIEFHPERVRELLAKEQNIQALDWLRRKQEELLRIRRKN